MYNLFGGTGKSFMDGKMMGLEEKPQEKL